MDPEQIRLQADLSGLIDGDVHCDPIYTQMYASDASIYEMRPLGVARPRSTRDVSELVKYCRENNVGIFARGGGSGLAGQSLGRGLVVDFSRYMRRIHPPKAGTVRVQSGVVQADLNRTIGYHDLLFGPDPATRSVSSIGSMLAVDAAGSHFPMYGSAGDCVESMQVVLADGEVVELSSHAWSDPVAPPDEESTHKSLPQLAQATGVLLQKSAGLLLRSPWGEVSRGCGYRVEKVLDGDRVHLARLMCGAEGTLGLITEATLRCSPVPPVRGLILLFFDRLETAAKAALDFGKEQVAACDLMDRRLLEIARETEPVYETIIPRGAEAMLLVELQGDEALAVRSRLMGLLHRIQKRNKNVVSYRITTDRTERNLLWRLARRVIPRLYKLKGNTRPLPFVEDMSVPAKRLPDFMKEVQNVLKAERVTATLFAHALHGQVDIRPFLDLADPNHQIRLTRLSELLFEKVAEFDGCVSGEHAIGLSRAAWAEKQLGPRLELCRKIKQEFDPTSVFNPGKFLSPTPPRVNEHLRPVPQFLLRQKTITAGVALGEQGLSDIVRLDGPGPAVAEPTSLPAAEATERVELPVLLEWKESESLAFTSRACNGCGRCRTSAMAERMCPMFRVHKGEEASPRAKANLLRGLLTGRLEQEHLESDELKAVSDLCFNCHQCRTECPANVNIPKLVIEAKAQHAASHGLRLSERLLNRVDLLAALGSRMPRLANWCLSNNTMRWMLEKCVGIAQGRKLPRIAKRSFLSWATRQKLNRPNRAAGRKVLFFVDQYVNWHNPLIGRAVVEVLRHQNVDVYVPTNQTPSWMSMIASGDIQRARKLVQTNIKLLADAIRQGYEVVTSEPSAALCLQQEYRALVDNEDTRLIAEHTQEICGYLWNLHQVNELELDLRPVNLSVVYHEPCHARTLNPSGPAQNLLSLIPALQIQPANVGCSGMAGTYGLQRKNFRNSVRIGWGLISTMKETGAQFGTTECTACKLQMEQGTTKPTVHPVALLAYAYGIMPQFGGWFTARNDQKLVS